MKHSFASVAARSVSYLDFKPNPQRSFVHEKVRCDVRSPSSSSAKLGNIRATTISFGNIHKHGELLVRYLNARREIFIERLNWKVAQVDGMEFDQYDTPFCRWVVLHDFGEVVAGVRLLPTTAQCGMYSYMLRDAQLGILPDIPTDALFLKAPVNPLIWEASRFFISVDVPAAHRKNVQLRLFESMSAVAKENGALHMLGIVPSVWSRWARRLDANAIPIGARFSIDGTRSQSVQFCVDQFLNEPKDTLGNTPINSCFTV